MFLIDNQGITDPAINLALEDYCVRNLVPGTNYILFYINGPSVIIGKHQNPFLEADVSHVVEKGIGLFRRISGGGAVYHDHGNLNFSFITPFGTKGLKVFKSLLQPVLLILETLGIQLEIKENNTIFIEGRKISGNAQYTNMNRVLSHGTLLYSTDLRALHKALDSKSDILNSRGIDSIRSSVTNISEYLTEAEDIFRFRQKLVKAAETSFGGLAIHKLSQKQWDDIYRLAENKYHSWNWNYGNTPPFSVRHRINSTLHKLSVILHVERGYITRIEIEEEAGNNTASIWEKRLIGEPYNEILSKIEDHNLLP